MAKTARPELARDGVERAYDNLAFETALATIKKSGRIIAKVIVECFLGLLCKFNPVSQEQYPRDDRGLKPPLHEHGDRERFPRPGRLLEEHPATGGKKRLVGRLNWTVTDTPKLFAVRPDGTGDVTGPLRAGIAGYGYMGEIRARNVADHPDLKLAGICDPRRPAEIGALGVPVYPTWQALVDADLDVVFACTPNNLIPEVAVRALEPTDSLEELTELLHRAYRGLADMGLRYTASHQPVEVTARRIARGECTVCLLDGRLVATITLNPPEATHGAPWYDRPDVASFNQLAVDPGLQRLGLGSLLLDLVEARAMTLGALELACDTSDQAEHLIRLYGARGYRLIEHVDWRPQVNYCSVILSKALRPV